jgi:hypothetical protein
MFPQDSFRLDAQSVKQVTERCKFVSAKGADFV